MNFIHNGTIEKMSYSSSFGRVLISKYDLCYEQMLHYHIRVSTEEKIIIKDESYSEDYLEYSPKMSNTRNEPSEILKKYTTDEAIEYLKKSNKFDIKEIAELLEWLDNKYSKKFGTPEVELIVDEKTDEIEFLEIIFPNGSWEEWGMLVNEIKNKMRDLGYGHLCSKVAIVCLQGLIE